MFGDQGKRYEYKEKIETGAGCSYELGESSGQSLRGYEIESGIF